MHTLVYTSRLLFFMLFIMLAGFAPASAQVARNGPFSISGIITDERGMALGGVSVALSRSGDIATTITTAGDGGYSFHNLAGGSSYTLTPTKINYTFAPQNQTFGDLSADIKANFIGLPSDFSVGGVVTDRNGVGLGGVIVVLTGARSYVTTTAADGRYSISGLPPGASYTVTPNLRGYFFVPPSRSFSNVSGDRVANFIGAPVNCSISGMVKAAAGGLGIGGVQIHLSGARTATMLSAADGKYAFADLPCESNYTVSVSYGTPNFTSFLLDAPTSRSFDHLPDNLRADFTITPLVNAFESHLSGLDAGDFNRDGKPDLVVGSFNSVHVLTGRGDGTFERGAGYNLGNQPKLVSISDFNGDGSLDVIVGSTGSNGTVHTLTVLLGNGDGTLRIVTTIPMNAEIQSIASSDFDGDRNIDIVTAIHSVSVTGSSISKVGVFLGNGDGTFRRTVEYEGGFYLNSVIAADISGDGKPDLVTTNQASKDNLKTFLNRGDGTFAEARSYSVGHGFRALAAGDFNADGKTDLAAGTSFANVNTVSIFLGNGDGTFHSPAAYDGGVTPNSIKSGDLNGDGNSDLVLLNLERGIGILPGRGDGTFMNAAVYKYTPDHHSYTFGLALADFNADGKLDLSVSGIDRRSSVGYGTGQVGAILNSPALPAGGATSSISGQLRDGDGNPLAGVSVIFSGRQSGSTVTDAGGNYTLTNIPIGAQISISPVKRFYSFSPSSRVVTPEGNNSGIDFIGGRDRFLVAGQLKEGGNVLSNVPVTLNSRAPGFAQARAITDGGGHYSFADVPAGELYTITPARPGYAFYPSQQGLLLAGNRSDLNFIGYALPASAQFSSVNFSASEGDGRAVIVLTRTGNTAGVASVSYATVDNRAPVRCDDTATMPGTAFARCDYATSIDTVSFAAGETERSFTIPIIDDTHVEGDETVQIKLLDSTGVPINSQSTALLSIRDNDTAGTSNPIDNSSFFVRMQYLDFLSREPEASEPWSGVLSRCPDVNNDAACDRILVSQSFFGSPEFRLKGFYAFAFYQVAFGRLPEYEEIIPDMRSVTGATAQEVYQKRAQLAVDLTGRQEFKAAYDPLGNQQYVDTLMNRYGLQQITTVDPMAPDGSMKVMLSRAEMVNRLNAQGTMALTRAQVLRALVQSDEVGAVEYNRAFVAMQYYGYLRRKPEADGYQAWLRVLNQDPNNVRIMVNGFMNSTEYRLRFGRVH